MITDNDVKKLKTVFATKDDLKRFATKDDLKRFATKDDLKKFVTGEHFNKVTTNLVKEVVSLRSDVDWIKETMVTKDDFREVMTGIDKVYGELVNKRQEQATLGQRQNDVEEEVRKHAKRLDEQSSLLDKIEQVLQAAH